MAAAAEEKQAPAMNYVFLGKTGIKVSEICIGTMSFAHRAGTSSWGFPVASEEDAFSMLDAFVNAGGNFIDTADVYSSGESEEVIGSWLSRKGPAFRSQIILATKCRFPTGTGVNDVGLSRKHIIESVNASLQRLKTDYIDIFQLHCSDPRVLIVDTLSVLNTLVQQGKVRYIGVSNFLGFQLQEALDISKYHHLESFVTLQLEYNLLGRGPELELLKVAEKENLAVLAWSPLAAGWLTGKYKRGQLAPPPGSRVEWAEKTHRTDRDWTHVANERTWGILDVVSSIAQETGRTIAQVALRWLIQKQGCTVIPILGPRTMQHLSENLGVVGWRLSDAQMERLNQVSDVIKPSPYGFVDMMNQSRS